MRYATTHKAETRQRILHSASRLFAERGFAATSIDDIMRDARLTHGGFYAHFKSKSQLYRDAIALAPHCQNQDVGACADTCTNGAGTDELLEEFLSSKIRFFATDVARREPDVRAAYATAFKAMSAQIKTRIAAKFSCSDATAIALTSMIVGAVAIGQTVDDAELKAKLLSSCKDNMKALLEAGDEQVFFWTPPGLMNSG
jgi:TetR/AcrR family transcriptional repressor of nem operon